MENYVPPLSVIFVWHPADKDVVKPIIQHCTTLLSRDINKPFSRSMNLPIFYRTTTNNGIPTKIQILSKKALICIFAGQNVVSNDDWVAYISDIELTENAYVVPIALDETAFNINGLNKLNWIRSYEYENCKFLNEYMFISITHEIYRYTLNDSFKKKNIGSDKAIKLFLSHAKDKENGIRLAKDLKHFIDNSTMNNFFDATDIAPGHKFNDEIIEHIKQSTVIAIHSDSYSSKYWCQMEILSAKEHDRPIVAVDSIEEFEDRRFPFASNVPYVYVHMRDKPSEKDLLRILEAALLETVRFYYSTLVLEEAKRVGWINADSFIYPRPPEASDVSKIFIKNGDNISCRHNALVYPEPPVYNEEMAFLKDLGIEIDTPLTCNVCNLKGRRIGVSISDPNDEELIAIGQNKVHLTRVAQDLARHLLIREATLIYGGDLRQDGFTKFIFDEALAVQARTKSQNIHVENYIAWPIYKKDTAQVTKWKAEYLSIAKMIELTPSDDVDDLIINKDIFLSPTNAQNRFVWSRCLTNMRREMIGSCDVRISAGGRHSGYAGCMPGVLEEIWIALEMEKPIFLLGGFGGVTASVCGLIQNEEESEKLTEQWQIKNNSEYKEMLDFGLSRGNQYVVDYLSIKERLKQADLKNGLSEEDNLKLFNTPFADEALFLVFKGLQVIYGSKE